MTIVHIDTGREMRGGQWQALYLMRGLQIRGHVVRLYGRASSPLYQQAHAEGIETRPVRFSAMPWLRDADLVHAHDARAHTLGLLTSKPLVVARRVAFAVRDSAASRLKYRLPHHFIAVSRFVKKILLDAGISADKISVVYDGVPLEEFSPAHTRAGVIALNMDDPGKGKTILEEAARISGVPVCFSRDLMHDLPGAALFVYISASEGLGSAALLAMAAGTPVVASRIEGLTEVIEDGVSGVFTNNDPPQVAASILGMLGNKEFAERCARAGRARVERCFSLNRMIEGTLAVYEKVLA